MKPKRSRQQVDRLFSDGNWESGSFTFDASVSAVFDNMLDRSIPHYRSLQGLIGSLVLRCLPEGGLVLDLGCSHGATALTLAPPLSQRGGRYLGLDKSPDMITEARKQCRDLDKFALFQVQDLEKNPALPTADVVIANLCLQFLSYGGRQRLLKAAYQALTPGGVIIVVEKCEDMNTDHRLLFRDIYHEFKRTNGYSDVEIAAKDRALTGVLSPLSLPENTDLLADAGFSGVRTFFQWMAFAGFYGLKEVS